MSFPNLKVLNRFLDDYLEIRGATHWNSKVVNLVDDGKQKLAKGAQALADFSSSLLLFSSQTNNKPKPPAEQKEELNDKVLRGDNNEKLKTLFAETKTVEDWIKRVDRLGADARTAFKQSSVSLYGRTLHAMRTYILSFIQNEPAFIKHRDELSQGLLPACNAVTAEKLQGVDCSNSEASRNRLIYSLADLGHDSASILGVDCNLFGEMKMPDKRLHMVPPSLQNLSAEHRRPKVNCYKPWPYQDEWYQRFCEVELAEFTQFKTESFAEFTERAEREEGKVKAPPTLMQQASDVLWSVVKNGPGQGP